MRSRRLKKMVQHVGRWRGYFPSPELHEVPMEAAQLMELAIAKTREGIRAGQTPFGCAIARGDEVLAVCHNVVWLTCDITAHAEVTAIRAACQATDSILLEGCVVATTCEPCPMCMAALHWARVETVYFGAAIADAAQAGFNELNISASELLRIGRSQVKLHGNVLAKECRDLFTLWHSGDPAAY